MADDFPKLSRADHARSRALVQLDHDQWLDQWAFLLPFVLAAVCFIRLVLLPVSPVVTGWAGQGAVAVLAAGLTGWLAWWLLHQQDENPHLVLMAGCLPLLSQQNGVDALALLAVLWAMVSAMPLLAALGSALAVVLYPPFVLLAGFTLLGVGRAGLLRYCVWLVVALLLWAALLLGWKDARDAWLLSQKVAVPSPHAIGIMLSFMLSGGCAAIYFRLRRRDLMDAYPAMGLIPPIMVLQSIGLVAGGRLLHVGWLLAAPALGIVWDMMWPLVPLRFVPYGRWGCYGALAAAVIYSLIVG